jgi:hypothetical protein
VWHKQLRQAWLTVLLPLCALTHCAGEGHLMSWDEHIMLIAHTVNFYGDRLKVCCRCCCGAAHVLQQSSCVLGVPTGWVWRSFRHQATKASTCTLAYQPSAYHSSRAQDVSL